jgi:hypothetical protein
MLSLLPADEIEGFANAGSAPISFGYQFATEIRSAPAFPALQVI